jgi:hypothetical protein
METVDLYVVGSDFYRGSTSGIGRLKDGWCDFRTLGNSFAQGYFGTSRTIGNVWYFAEKVLPSTSKSFEEHLRQEIWLKSLGPSVTKLVSAPRNRRLGGDDAGIRQVENSGSPGLNEMLPILTKKPLAGEAVVIWADGSSQPSLHEFLDERLDRGLLQLIPPDLRASGDAVSFSHDDLAAAQLEDEEAWLLYQRSKGREQFANSITRSDELRAWLT